MKNAEGPFSASRSQIERSLYAKFFIGPFLLGIAFTPSLVGYPQLKEAGCKRKRVQKSRSYWSVISRGESALWAVQLINRFRLPGFCPDNFYFSVHAFFCNRLESIRLNRIYSAQENFRVEMAELEILRTNCARSEIEMPKKGPQHFSSDLF